MTFIEIYQTGMLLFVLFILAIHRSIKPVPYLWLGLTLCTLLYPLTLLACFLWAIWDIIKKGPPDDLGGTT